MKRTNIYLTDRQWKELNKRANKIDISVAELIRRILDGKLFPQRAGA
jgi:predicted DNA-binding ribbon-helix-helix protein